MLGWVGKMSKKRVKEMLKNICFFQRCDTSILKYSFYKICSFNDKKVIGYFRFFLYRLLNALYPTLHVLKKYTKNPLNFYSLKVTNFHGDSVKNESVGAKKLEGAPNAPPPSLFRVNLL